jgi:hypothetical protein
VAARAGLPYFRLAPGPHPPRQPRAVTDRGRRARSALPPLKAPGDRCLLSRSPFESLNGIDNQLAHSDWGTRGQGPLRAVRRRPQQRADPTATFLRLPGQAAPGACPGAT